MRAFLGTPGYARRAPDYGSSRARAAPRGSPLRQSCAALDSPDVAAASARRAASGFPRFRRRPFFISTSRGPRRGTSEPDPTATLAGHATALGTISPTGPTKPVRVVDVRALFSSSDVERTDLADWSLAVCRTLLQIRKMFDALADALARRAQGPGGCSGQRSTHSESATVEFWPVRRFAAGSARRRRECRLEKG